MITTIERRGATAEIIPFEPDRVIPEWKTEFFFSCAQIYLALFSIVGGLC